MNSIDRDWQTNRMWVQKRAMAGFYHLCLIQFRDRGHKDAPGDHMQRFIQIGAIAILALTNQAGAGEAPHRLDLLPSDIDAAELRANTALINLAPAARTDLGRLTSQNHGKSLVITVDGLAATESQINATVDSGVVVIADPSDELRESLSELP